MTVLDAVYTAALLPIETAFELSLDSNPGFVGWWVLGIGAGVLSVLDVLMGFHIGRIVTLQLDKREVRDGRLVALYYMRHSTFWVDLLAAVAFLAQMALWVADVDSVAAMQILSFFRYLRIGRLVQRLFKAMSSASWVWGPLSNPVVISTLSLLYLTAVYVNFLGCFWYWVARREGIGGDNWLTWYGLTSELDQHGNMAFQAPLREQYLASIYFVVTTVTTVGYGDIIPVNPGEQLAAMLVQLSGLVVFGVLISTVVELGQGVNRSLRRGLVFSNKMRSVQRWMLRRNLPKELRQEVQLYYSGVWLRLQELAEREVLGELPHKLRARVVYTAVGELLREVQLFQGMERGDLLELSARLQSLIVAPGSSLSVEGDEANCIWLLERGEVRVFRYDKLLQILDRPGMMFGEMALLRYASPAYRMRMVSFRATTTCRVWHLPMQSLYPLLRARRELYEKLLDRLAAHLQGRLVGLAEGEREVVMDALQLVQRMRRTDLAQLSTSRPEASLPRSTSEELAEAADADTDADVLAEPDADDAPFAPDGRQPSCTSLTIGASAWRGEEHGRARPSGAAGSSCSASPLEEGEEPATAAQPGCQNGVPERAWMGIELQPSAKSQLQRCGTSMSSSSVSVLRTASVPPDDLRSCVRFEPLQHQGATAPPPPHAACPAAAALPMQQPACQLARTCPRSSVASQPAARAAPLTQHRSRPCATMSGEERRPVSQRRGAHLEAALYSTHPTSHISTHDFPPAIPPSPHASSPSDLWTSLPNGSHALHNDPWLAELDSEGATNPFAANLSPRQLGRSPFDTASLNAGLP